MSSCVSLFYLFRVNDPHVTTKTSFADSFRPFLCNLEVDKWWLLITPAKSHLNKKGGQYNYKNSLSHSISLTTNTTKYIETSLSCNQMNVLEKSLRYNVIFY